MGLCAANGQRDQPHTLPHIHIPYNKKTTTTANGTALPLFSLFFGDFTQAFGTFVPPCAADAAAISAAAAAAGFAPTSVAQFRATIAGVAYKFLYVAAGACVAGALQQACWTHTATRQVREAAGGRGANAVLRRGGGCQKRGHLDPRPAHKQRSHI